MATEMVAAPAPAAPKSSTLKTVAVVLGLALFAYSAVYVYRVEKAHRARMKFLRAKYGPGLSNEEMIVRDVQGR